MIVVALHAIAGDLPGRRPKWVVVMRHRVNARLQPLRAKWSRCWLESIERNECDVIHMIKDPLYTPFVRILHLSVLIGLDRKA